MFCCAGTLALMARHRNNIHIFFYTNGDKGSNDPDMTSERMSSIRAKEEENASTILGIPAANIHWLEYHDGMLEYADPRDLVDEVTRIIRQYRPDVVMAPDPGSEHVRWHKTDHRMAANNTIDAIRAAEWHLYFPNQRAHEGLMPWKVPTEAYFYVTAQDANSWVNIDDVLDLKMDAAAAHVSQCPPATDEVSRGLGSQGIGGDEAGAARAATQERRTYGGSLPHRGRVQSAMSELAILGGSPVRRKPFAPWPQYLPTDLERVRGVIESRHWGGYPMPSRYAGEFAEHFAAMHGAKYGLCVANGTIALVAALTGGGDSIRRRSDRAGIHVGRDCDGGLVCGRRAGVRRRRSGNVLPDGGDGTRGADAADAGAAAGALGDAVRGHGWTDGARRGARSEDRRGLRARARRAISRARRGVDGRYRMLQFAGKQADDGG